MNTRDELVEAMAKYLWGSAWMDYCDDLGITQSGVDGYYDAPPVPQAAQNAAWALIGAMQARVGPAAPCGIYNLLQTLNAEDCVDTAETAGCALAAEALENGVTWEDEDRRKPHGLVIPHIDIQTDDELGETFDWSF